LVESAKVADRIRAAEVCGGVKPGEIVIFDRAYVDFIHLGVLNGDGVFWVTRSKESVCFRVVKKLPVATDKRILNEASILLVQGCWSCFQSGRSSGHLGGATRRHPEQGDRA
jgi:hypothetical protein